MFLPADELKWCPAVIRCECNVAYFLYLPIFLQDEVTIITWIEKVGNKSMEAAYEIYKRSGSSVVQVATAKTVMVSFDHAQGVSIPWRDELRAPLEGFGIGRPLGL